MTDSKNTTDTGETLPGVDVSDWPETADVTHDVPDWLIPSRVYDILKWLGLIVLPALALFVNTVGPAWGWPHVDAIVTTLNALGILAGALIGVSAIKQRIDLAVVPEFLRTLVFARPRGDDQFADCTFSPSLDMSR